MFRKNAVVALLPLALAMSVVAGAAAEAPRTLKVEVRVWQDVDDERRLWLSARPAGGSWARMGTVPLWLDDGGRHRYGDITLGAAPDAIDTGDRLGEGYYFLDDYYVRGRFDAPLLIRVPAGRKLSWLTVVVGGSGVEAFIIKDTETGSRVYYDARTGRETKRWLPTMDAETQDAVNAFLDRVSSAARPAPVPVAELRWATPVEVRLWQDVRDGRRIHLSARAEGGSWRETGTIPLPLDDGLSVTGRYRYGDAVIALSRPPPPSCADAALAADCAALLAARDALAGDGSLNWSASVPVAQWDGVTVSGTPRRVTGLALRSRGLTGAVPPELADLSALKALKLAGNDELGGCVPPGVRSVPRNDLARLTVPTCGVTVANTGMPLDGGRTYQLGISGLRDLLLDIPAAARGIEFRSMSYEGLWGIVYCLADAAHPGSRLCLRRHDAASVINHVPGEGSAAAAARAIFDRIAASARLEP